MLDRFIRRQTRGACQFPDGAKDLATTLTACLTGGDGREHLLIQEINARVGMDPGIEQRLFVKGSDQFLDVCELQQARPCRNEQADRILDGSNMLGQIQIVEERKQIEIPLKSGPGRKGHKGGIERQAHLLKEVSHLDEIVARVELLEILENTIINRFDGTGHKQAASGAQDGNGVGVLDQVLNLNGHIIRQVGKFLMQLLNQMQRVSWPIEKVGIAKGDVLCAGPDLLANILHHDVRLNNPKASPVDGHNRTVPAEMFATTARLGVAGRSLLT